MPYQSGVLAAMLLSLAAAGSLSAQDDSLRFTSITSGGGHSCALTAEGRAYCWGRNEAGQLGDSTTTSRAKPAPVVGSIVFRALSAGGRHTCGIAKDGDDAYCWGANEHGQLGNGGRNNFSYPFKVAADLRVASIAAGGEHTCATQIHWDRQDRMVCWGSNENGQLGHQLMNEDASLPIETFGVIRYVSVAAGGQHTCGATREGSVFCWGANARGELGNASTTPSRVPFPIRLNRRPTVKAVVAGTAHTCALLGEGEVLCWGENKAGQAGNGKTGRVLSPSGVKGDFRFRELLAGGDVTCGFLKGGEGVACWGSNATGLMGEGAGPGSSVPVPVFAGMTPVAISLGAGHGCGLKADSTAWCWSRPTP
jgi:alpha-tubulin suppressor-like RCC1 family protein